MPMPVMTLANATATGDMIVGPGALTSMVKGLPIACLGDAVAGPVCVSGVITASMSPNVLAKGRVLPARDRFVREPPRPAGDSACALRRSCSGAGRRGADRGRARADRNLRGHRRDDLGRKLACDACGDTCRGRGTPAEILRDVNAQLCEGNGSDMFVTVYLVVLDLATGRGLAANAGHADPVLRRAGGCFELVRYRHDRMLAMWPGLAFTDRAFELRPGDTLLVYTDGVPESATADQTFYGTDRLVTFLNGCRELALAPLVKALRADVAAFADGAPQSDDITVLAVTYNGNSQ